MKRTPKTKAKPQARTAVSVPTLSGCYAVYLAAVPSHFQPTGFREVPEVMHAGRLVAARLDEALATAFVRAFNERAAEQRGTTWAFIALLPDVPDFSSEPYRHHQAAYQALVDALSDPPAAGNGGGR